MSEPIRSVSGDTFDLVALTNKGFAMFSVFQKMASGFTLKKQEQSIPELQVMRVPVCNQVLQQPERKSSYDSLNAIFDEMLAEQQNSLGKW